MEQSLFDSFNARFLQPSQIARGFVDPAHFALVCERNHSVIVGPRGSGKTTLLKMLQIQALKTWHSPHRKALLKRIDFTSIYVAADSSWSTLFASNDFEVREDLRDAIAQALLVVYIQFAIVDTLEELSDTELCEDELLRRFHIPIASTENNLAKALAAVWSIAGVTPTYLILRSKLAQRLNDLATISDAAKFGQYRSAADAIGHFSFLSLRHDFVLKNSVDAINSISGQKHRKWCICFDELEIIPTALRNLLFKGLRSSDQRLLFKMSVSPFSADLPRRTDQNGPMPGQDYMEIYLSYPRSQDAIRFGRELVNSLLEEAELGDTSPESVFGRSSVATADPSLPTPAAAYQAPHGDRFRLLSRLRDLDPSFRQFLLERNYDIHRMPALPEKKRAELRKLLQIVRNRIEFRQFGKSEKGRNLVGYRRSRKRIHEIYTGLEALLTICEGNPRWIIGVLRPQILQYKWNRDHGNQAPLDRSYQARRILQIIGRYRALLGTIPLKGGTKGVRASVLRLIDQIGEYMFRDVVLGTFKPEPVLSFLLDAAVTPAQVEAIGTAVNQGAFIPVPNRKGEITTDGIVNLRFRLSYLLAPDFQLPLTYGAQINLSTIINRVSSNQQMKLDEV